MEEIEYLDTEYAWSQPSTFMKYIFNTEKKE